MATFDLPETSEPRMSSHLMVGAASPLWAYFGAAAAGGLAYWWMTQWTRPMNLEAMFAKASTFTGAPGPVVAATEAIVEVMEAAQEAMVEAASELPSAPLGGESGPISPILEVASLAQPEPPAPVAAPEPVVEAVADPVETLIEAKPEPAVEAAAEPAIEEPAAALGEPASKPRGKKAASSAIEGDA